MGQEFGGAGADVGFGPFREAAVEEFMDKSVEGGRGRVDDTGFAVKVAVHVPAPGLFADEALLDLSLPKFVINSAEVADAPVLHASKYSHHPLLDFPCLGCKGGAIVTLMSDTIHHADPEKVEMLISCMLGGLKDAGEFTASDGVSAALTFAMRMCKIIVQLSPDEESRKENMRSAVRSLKVMAAELEAEVAELKNVKVH